MGPADSSAVSLDAETAVGVAPAGAGETGAGRFASAAGAGAGFDNVSMVDVSTVSRLKYESTCVVPHRCDFGERKKRAPIFLPGVTHKRRGDGGG